jgi:transposase InsO family protein
MGPFPVETPSGGKYLLTLQDIAAGYSFVDVLKTKDEANGILLDVIPTLEKQTQCQVKILHSENGGEFANKTLGAFLTGKGIIAKQSLPYHHYQNGVIERFNQTVAETRRTVLSNSKLPKLFWGFAFIWANHLLNRISNKTSGKKTPYKVLFNQVPHFDAFWVFGLKAYIHVPPEKRIKTGQLCT